MASANSEENVSNSHTADDLCRHVRDPVQRLRVLSGLNVVYLVRAELRHYILGLLTSRQLHVPARDR